MAESMQPGTGPVIVLETERLRLRRFVPGDVDRLVELDSDPEVMRYISFGLPTPRERYERRLLPRWLALYAEAPLLGYWAAEIISARTLAANAASQRVMQKCGLLFERTFAYPEDVIAGRTAAERAAVKFSVTRSAWLARRV